MAEIEGFGKRLAALRAASKEGQEALAVALGLTKSAVSKFEKDKGLPSPDNLVKLARHFGVSVDYLLTGAESSGYQVPDSGSSVTEEPKLAGKDRVIIVDQSDNAVAPIINYKAAASYTGYDSQEFLEPIDSISLPATLVKGGEHMVFPVIGDSMEPTFYAKDYVLCRRIMRPDWGHIPDFTVCVVYSTTHGLQLKRLKIRPKESLVRCKSDNRAHRSYNLDMEDVLEIWRFEWRLTASAENVTQDLFAKVDNLEDTVQDLRIIVEGMQDESELRRLLDIKTRTSNNLRKS